MTTQSTTTKEALGAEIMKEVTRYNDGNGCTRRQLVDNILILIDQSSRVPAPIVAPVVDAEMESVDEAAAEIKRLTAWQDLCFELLSEIRQWVAPGSITDTDAPRVLRAMLGERARLRAAASTVAPVEQSERKREIFDAGFGRPDTRARSCDYRYHECSAEGVTVNGVWTCNKEHLKSELELIRKRFTDYYQGFERDVVVKDLKRLLEICDLLTLQSP